MSQNVSFTYLNGSYYDGGQVIRMALAFSCLLIKPIKISHIGVRRRTIGLKFSHVKAIELAQQMCGGIVEGAHVGSTEFTFRPGPDIKSGKYRITTGSIGGMNILTQVGIPIALFAPCDVDLIVDGGKKREPAASTEYIQSVFRTHAMKFKADFDCSLDIKTFFPNNIGNLTYYVYPVRQLIATNLTNPGKIVEFWGTVFMAKNDTILAEQMKATAIECLNREFPNISVYLDIEIDYETYHSIESGVSLYAETSNDDYMGDSVFLEDFIPPLQTVRNFANKFAFYLKLGSYLDEHAQDQLITFMTLAKGESQILAGPLTSHTLSAMYVAEVMARCEISHAATHENLNRIIVTGIGLKNRYPDELLDFKGDI